MSENEIIANRNWPAIGRFEIVATLYADNDYSDHYAGRLAATDSAAIDDGTALMVGVVVEAVAYGAVLGRAARWGLVMHDVDSGEDEGFIATDDDGAPVHSRFLPLAAQAVETAEQALERIVAGEREYHAG